jgi:hypothetical protein
MLQYYLLCSLVSSSFFFQTGDSDQCVFLVGWNWYLRTIPVQTSGIYFVLGIQCHLLVVSLNHGSKKLRNPDVSLVTNPCLPA